MDYTQLTDDELRRKVLSRAICEVHCQVKERDEWGKGWEDIRRLMRTRVTAMSLLSRYRKVKGRGSPRPYEEEVKG